MRRRSVLFTLGASVLLAISATGSVSAGTNHRHAGNVYTLSNLSTGNSVIAYTRGADGSLSPLGTYPTGGLGGGGGLGSQGAIVLSAGGRLLITVDAGSDEITSFRVRQDGSLRWADRIGSGGDHPISVTIHGRLVYVVNDGGDGNIAAFRIDRHGDLHAIAGSARPLSGSGSGPAEIAFTPRGDALLVTEKATNRLLGYRVGDDGRASGPSILPSAGTTPFGFAFDPKGRAIVSEASGGAAGASTVSSYRVSRHGNVRLVDGPIATDQGAACWVATAPNGRYAYVANTGSGTITGFAIRRDGSLKLLDADGVTGVTGPGTSPADLATSASGRFLYVLNGGSDSLGAYRIGRDGSLTALAGVTGLPGPGVGLAVR